MIPGSQPAAWFVVGYPMRVPEELTIDRANELLEALGRSKAMMMFGGDATGESCANWSDPVYASEVYFGVAVADVYRAVRIDYFRLADIERAFASVSSQRTAYARALDSLRERFPFLPEGVTDQEPMCALLWSAGNYQSSASLHLGTAGSAEIVPGAIRIDVDFDRERSSAWTRKALETFTTFDDDTPEAFFEWLDTLDDRIDTHGSFEYEDAGFVLGTRLCTLHEGICSRSFTLDEMREHDANGASLGIRDAQFVLRSTIWDAGSTSTYSKTDATWTQANGEAEVMVYNEDDQVHSTLGDLLREKLGDQD